MKTNIFIVLALAVIALAYTYGADRGFFSSAPQFEQTDIKPEPGKLVPDFSFTTINGQKHSLFEFKGKRVLVHFWASWCAPCLKEFPSLLAYAKKEKAVVIALSHDTTDGAIERFLKKMESPLPETLYVARDYNSHIAEKQYGTFKLPETYVIAPDMTLTKKISGAQEW